jgi:predicted permease
MLDWLKRLKPRRTTLDDDFADEIRSHLSLAAAERMADGADPKTAQLASLKEFGNVTLTIEAARRVWTPWWVEAVHDQLSDIRYAIRALAKNPVFALTVVAVLTLGIGLNAAVFTMLKGIALRPLGGVARAVELVVMYAETNTGRDVRLSYPDYQYIRDHQRVFSGLFGSSLITASLGRGRSARQVSGELVTGTFFQVLGVRAALGRTLLPSDEVAAGRHPVIVLSDGLWRRDFSADPDIVGKTVEINNYPLTVVGVADPSFHGTIVSYDVEVFMPVMMAAQILTDLGSGQLSPTTFLTDRRANVLYPHGYLREGTSLANASAQIDALWATLARDRPLTDATQRLRLVRFWQVPGSGQANTLPTLAVLTVMGLLLLLIACANLAGLVLVRGLARRGELGVRLALGATRTRIVRLLIVENLVLAVPGAIFGVTLAWQVIPPMIAYAEWLAAPQRLFLNIAVDRLVIAFAVLVGCGSALACGFVPALQVSRIDLNSVLKDDLSPRGAARGRMRASLVVAQVAVSLLLLIGAGLVARSLDATRKAYPGFDASQVSTVAVNVRQNRYDERRGRVFYRRLLDESRAEAGIESATLAANHPLGFLDTPSRRVTIEGYQLQRGEDLAFMSNTIASDYFRTLRIAVLAGRSFDDGDDESAIPVAIVNHTLAQKFWGSDANAIGKRLRFADGDWRSIVGVAADVKYSRINEPPRPYVYLPFFQAYRSQMVAYTRGSAPVTTLVDQTRARIAALDADLPIMSARPLTEELIGAQLFLNLMAKMLLIFGVAGMALAAMGTYGLVSYTVKQSSHEIGIRMALGATRLSVIRAFLGRGLRLGSIGAALGIAAALALTRLLDSMLFGVSATDAVSFGRAIALVLGGVIIATVVPAWRAARTNPLAALRHQ